MYRKLTDNRRLSPLENRTNVAALYRIIRRECSPRGWGCTCLLHHEERDISGKGGKDLRGNQRPTRTRFASSCISLRCVRTRLLAIDIALVDPYEDLDRIESIPLRVTACSLVRPFSRSFVSRRRVSPRASASRSTRGSFLHPRVTRIRPLTNLPSFSWRA